jgi:diphthamide biosynthesis protein 2
VACPENSIVESKEFFKPIVTPYELEIALQPEQSWTGRYVLDFGKLLTQGKGKALDTEDPDDDHPVFSLVTGTYRHPKQFGESARAEEPITSAVILRNSETAMMQTSGSAAGQYLQSRSYQGLEARVGEEAPSVLEQGRSGIARDYQGG